MNEYHQGSNIRKIVSYIFGRKNMLNHRVTNPDVLHDSV